MQEITNFIDQEWLTLEEAAELAQVNISTVRAAVAKKELTVMDGVSKGYRTTRGWVNAWLATKVIPASTEQGEQ